MRLSDLLASAVQNPDQQANPNELGQMAGMLQGLGGQTGASPSAMQTLMSLVGNQVRASLRDRRDSQGPEAVQSVVNQYGALEQSPQAVNEVLSPQQQTHVAEEAAQQTGLPMQQIVGLLPVVVPMVLKLLQSGNYNRAPGATQPGGNPLLNTFLDADRDGDVDIGDAMKLTTTFLRF